MDPAAAGYQGRIAFIADGDVWVARPDGGGPTNLTNTPAQSSAERDPAWPPDLDPATAGYQGRIAFASTAAARAKGCVANEDVYTIQTTGGGELRLTEERTATESRPGRPTGPRSPSGPTGRGSTGYPDGVGLYVMDVSGGNKRKIRATTPDGVSTNVSFPNWSPQGNRIAVNGDANHPGIRVVDPRPERSGRS